MGAETAGLRKPAGGKQPAAAPASLNVVPAAAAAEASSTAVATVPGALPTICFRLLQSYIQRLAEVQTSPADSSCLWERAQSASNVGFMHDFDEGHRPVPPYETLEALPAGEAGKPKRSVAEWRPVPLLCKRLNVADPYRGRPPPPPLAPPPLPWTLADLGQSRCLFFSQGLSCVGPWQLARSGALPKFTSNRLP